MIKKSEVSLDNLELVTEREIYVWAVAARASQPTITQEQSTQTSNNSNISVIA